MANTPPVVVNRQQSNSLQVDSSPADPLVRITGFRLGWQQFAALNKKNVVIRSRSWKTNLMLVLQAVLFVTLIWIVNRAVLASNQRRPAFSNVPDAVPEVVGSIPDCGNNRFVRHGQRCYSVLYTPAGVAPIDEIMAAVADNNVPPLPRQRIRGFTNGSDIDEYLLQHSETVLASVEFHVDNPQSIGFAVQTNTTVQWFKGTFQDPNLYIQLPLQTAVERELVRHISQKRELAWNVGVVQLPHPSAQSPSLLATFAPTFLFASIMFQFVQLLHDVVHERESGVRRLMQTMGLRQMPLWSAWVLLEGLLAIVETCLLIGFSYAYEFELFTKNAFGLSFLLLLLANFATMSFGFMIASTLRKASSSVPVGFFIFIVAWVMMIVIDFGFPYSTKYTTAPIAVFSLFPWSLLSKGIGDLAAAVDGSNQGISWADRSAYCKRSTPSPAEQARLSFFVTDCVMPLAQIFWVLAIQFVGYLLMAVWLDNVLPDEHGSRKSLLFFLSPRYWFPSTNRNEQSVVKALERHATSNKVLVDADVQAEGDKLRRDANSYVGGSIIAEEDRKHAIKMYGLRKVYNRGGILRKRPFCAVEGNWLVVYEGECFCLLGPNGAGKSTTIHCLTGVVPLTEGDAIIYGDSITSAGGMDRLRQIMGVCPQFDVQYDRLTGKEHLELYGSIKGLPRDMQKLEAIKLLEEVKLTEARNVTAGAYSGGMKRRLSVAMALLGDPKVVFLDEPTTGLDPISRRHLWDLVDKLKRGRCIILTTHSMEEADILGDRIGIMARGKLRCLGSSIRLKSRFGSGYNISVGVRGANKDAAVIMAVQESVGERQNDTVAAQQLASVKDLFQHRLGVKSVDQSNDYVHFLVPFEYEDRLPLLLAYLKMRANELGVTDVQMRLTPLEEVFLNVSRKAELEHAEAEGKFETLMLTEEGVGIKVPIGASFISSPGGHLYHIKWVQDDKGTLRIRDYQRDAYGNPELLEG